MITVVGYPRSGTHWLKVMLEHALGEKLAHSHTPPVGAGGQYAFIIRDPREVLASHWRLYKHDQPGQQTERGFVDYFLKGEGLRQHPWGVGWVAHTTQLLERNQSDPQRFPLVRHEQLYAAPERELERVLRALGRDDIPEMRIAEAVRHTRGKRCDPSSLPVEGNMGEPGKWQEQLRPETICAVLDYCGPLMGALDYEGVKDE